MAYIKNSETTCGFCGGTGAVNGAQCTCVQDRKEKSAERVSDKELSQRATGSGARVEP